MFSSSSSQILTGLNLLSSSSNPNKIPSEISSSYRFPLCCSVRSQGTLPVIEIQNKNQSSFSPNWTEIDEDDGDTRINPERSKPETGEKGNSDGIRVPRQKYISVPKTKLLDSLLTLFESQQQITDDFIRLSSYLDSILHAEHKSILEEMRMDYHLTETAEKNKNFDETKNVQLSGEKIMVNGKHNAEDSGSSTDKIERNGQMEAQEKEDDNALDFDIGIAVETRFQRAFMKLLLNAQFEELSARDLLLTSSLNTDYLLTLPIYVDWKKALESNAIIYRRGYATERQNGLLLAEKLDYLQSKLLQGFFSTLSRPAKKLGMYISEALRSASQTEEVQIWLRRFKNWFEKLSVSQRSYFLQDGFYDQLVADQISDSDLPIWLAAQRAVPRYEGLLSSVGPRGRLLRRLLTWTGIIPSMPETSSKIDTNKTTSKHYESSIFLPRISLGDIWRPATRERCGSVWNLLKTAASIFFSQSVLEEPAFQELILLYTEEIGQGDSRDKIEVPSLKLKIYEKIPIPDLTVIFPHKKLSFRILDTVRLDAASIVGLLAFLVNYKFENISSSPSAFLLDAIAFSALVLYVSRVVLGYKQTWDRYQLLVNRTLYEKTLASGFGSVHFLLDASEQQQYKEAILAYAVLIQAEIGQTTTRKSISEACEKFLYDKLNEKVEMPVDKAMETLLRFGLVTEEANGKGEISLKAVPCSEAYDVLKQRWSSLLG